MRRVAFLLLLAFLPALAEASIVPGGESAIRPDTLYFDYSEDDLRCGAIYDPLDRPASAAEPLAQVGFDLSANWGCQNPIPYPGPDADHHEVVVVGNTGKNGGGETVLYFFVTLDLDDLRWVDPSEARRIRADPVRAIRIEVERQLANQELRYKVGQSGVIAPHLEVSKLQYAPIDLESRKRTIYLSQVTWVRVAPQAIQLGFDGYPWLRSYTSQLTPVGFGAFWYWRARVEWGVLVRGRAHGNERPGTARLRLEIDRLVSQGRARTQALRAAGGRLAKVKISQRRKKELKEKGRKRSLVPVPGGGPPVLRLY